MDEEIRKHYQRVWGASRVSDVHWTPGPLASRLPSLHIAKVEPSPAEPFWTYATIGAWEASRDEKHNLEFVAVARTDAPIVLIRLGQIAFYHAGGPESRLGIGHTVPIGEGWTDGSPLDHFLVSLPYLWGPRLEDCVLSDRHIQVLWVLPIHDSERQYIADRGLDALERLFEERAIDYLDPFRPAVV